MTEIKLTKCPICNSNETENLLVLNCGNLDNSSLYSSVKVNACKNCGHIYNQLSSVEAEGLVKYYNEEYAPTNIGLTDKTGDRPGSGNENTVDRYDQLYGLIAKYINNNCRVLDAGCAMGGFLDYLSLKGLKNLSGIDPIVKYIEIAKKSGEYNVKVGSVESIPFDDKVFDLMIMDQVMEHLVEPTLAFKEAKRVLAAGGLLCFGVPDAVRYDKNYFFDFFWFLMREHIQHFDLEHLKLAAGQEGFELVDFSRSDTSIMSDKMILPNLNVIFRLVGRGAKLNITNDCFSLKEEIKRYITNNLKKLSNRREIFSPLIASQKPLYVWGIGREFLYLYASAGLAACNLAGLIDANSYKQQTSLAGGRKIVGVDVLSQAMPDSALIITAVAHTDAIKKKLAEINYSGQIIEL